MGGTTKNLKILRGVYPFDRLRAGSELVERLKMAKGHVPGGVCTEPVEGLKMTKLRFRMNTN